MGVVRGYRRGSRDDSGAAAAPRRVLEPGPVDPKRCSAAGTGVTGGAAGATASFAVITKDGAGRRVTHGGALVYVRVVPGPSIGGSEHVAAVKDHRDGTYSVTYSVAQRGDYSVHVTCNGEYIEGSPFQVFFASGAGAPAVPTLASQSGLVQPQPAAAAAALASPSFNPGAFGSGGMFPGMFPGLASSGRTPVPEVCKDFLNGRCIRLDCKYSHLPQNGMQGLMGPGAMGGIPGMQMGQPAAALLHFQQALAMQQALAAQQAAVRTSDVQTAAEMAAARAAEISRKLTLAGTDTKEDDESRSSSPPVRTKSKSRSRSRSRRRDRDRTNEHDRDRDRERRHSRRSHRSYNERDDEKVSSYDKRRDKRRHRGRSLSSQEDSVRRLGRWGEDEQDSQEERRSSKPSASRSLSPSRSLAKREKEEDEAQVQPKLAVKGPAADELEEMSESAASEGDDKAAELAGAAKEEVLPSASDVPVDDDSAKLPDAEQIAVKQPSDSSIDSDLKSYSEEMEIRKPALEGEEEVQAEVAQPIRNGVSGSGAAEEMVKLEEVTPELLEADVVKEHEGGEGVVGFLSEELKLLPDNATMFQDEVENVEASDPIVEVKAPQGVAGEDGAALSGAEQRKEEKEDEERAGHRSRRKHKSRRASQAGDSSEEALQQPQLGEEAKLARGSSESGAEEAASGSEGGSAEAKRKGRKRRGRDLERERHKERKRRRARDREKKRAEDEDGLAKEQDAELLSRRELEEPVGLKPADARGQDDMVEPMAKGPASDGQNFGVLEDKEDMGEQDGDDTVLAMAEEEKQRAREAREAAANGREEVERQEEAATAVVQPKHDSDGDATPNEDEEQARVSTPELGKSPKGAAGSDDSDSGEERWRQEEERVRELEKELELARVRAKAFQVRAEMKKRMKAAKLAAREAEAASVVVEKHESNHVEHGPYPEKHDGELKQDLSNVTGKQPSDGDERDMEVAGGGGGERLVEEKKREENSEDDEAEDSRLMKRKSKIHGERDQQSRRADISMDRGSEEEEKGVDRKYDSDNSDEIRERRLRAKKRERERKRRRQRDNTPSASRSSDTAPSSEENDRVQGSAKIIKARSSSHKRRKSRRMSVREKRSKRTSRHKEPSDDDSSE
eukprot:SM000001S04416  [mRNA]  locus=s1:42618:47140:- [translate_table: standard]